MRPSRSGGSVPFSQTQTGPPLTLSQDNAGNINWEYSSDEPDLWGVYDVGNVNGGQELATTGGDNSGMDARSFLNQQIVVRGISADLTTFQTPISNPVVPVIGP